MYVSIELGRSSFLFGVLDLGTAVQSSAMTPASPGAYVAAASAGCALPEVGKRGVGF